MSQDKKPINAVIGVRHHGASTFYVRRSERMVNYPGVWSLFSIQFKPEELPDPRDLAAAERLFERMSADRAGGVPVHVGKYLTFGSSDQNPMGVDVNLHLYEIEFGEEPRLNPTFYADGAWLTPEEYQIRSSDRRCGLCMRLWADYAWMAGITDRPFLPGNARIAEDDLTEAA